MATFAAREVILSAGSVYTPPILLRSGVGPGEELRELGVAVLRDLPVGRNLVDHPIVGLGLELRPEVRCTSLNARHTNCIVRFASGLAGAGANDMAFLALNMSAAVEEGLAHGYIGVSAFQTFSRGALRIVSTDPNAEPDIEIRMLSDERDLVRMRDGARRLFAIGRHPAVTGACDDTSHWAAPASRKLAAARSTPLTTSWTMRRSTPGSSHRGRHQHPVGTCRMGAPDDPRSVVDPACRVLGLQGLRVIDASIMPDVPRANTHLTCVMIGERMAAQLRRG